MPRPFKIALIAVGGCVALLTLAAAVVPLLLDSDSYKPRIEAAAAAASGLDVGIDGRLRLGLFPGLHVTLENVRLRHRDADIASVAEAAFGIALGPLLRREVRIDSIRLYQPRIALARNPDGTLDLPAPQPSDAASGPVELANLSVSDATLTYKDRASGAVYAAEGCDAAIPQLRIAGGNSAKAPNNLFFTAEVACRQLSGADLSAADVRLSAVARDGVFDLDPVTLRVFDAQGTGHIRVDFSGTVPHYRIVHSLQQFDIAQVFKARTAQELSAGRMDFTADLTLRGSSTVDLKRSTQGQVSLRGENLVLHGSDIDREIARIKSTQRFNLVDAGAFMFAGPFGLAVTKGYDFANVLQGSGGSSDIRLLVSDWQFRNGIAQARDVAMATDENRIAVRGDLDLVGQRFDDFTVALIDAGGCAILQQKIEGTFAQPKVAQASLLQTLAGPALGLFKKGKALFVEEKCAVFYTGSVAAPR